MPCELMMEIMGNHFATMATFVLVIDSLLLIKKKDLKSKEVSSKLIPLFITIIWDTEREIQTAFDMAEISRLVVHRGDFVHFK